MEGIINNINQLAKTAKTAKLLVSFIKSQQSQIETLNKEVEEQREYTRSYKAKFGLQKTLSKAYIEENNQLKERVKELEENEKKHIIMFASWLMDEGYLIAENPDFEINDYYDYWNIN